MDPHQEKIQSLGVPLRYPLTKRNMISSSSLIDRRTQIQIIELRHQLETEIKNVSCDKSIRIVIIKLFQSLCYEIIILQWAGSSWTFVYVCVDFPDILKLNEEACTDTKSMTALRDAIGLLFKYGVNLLRPEISSAWRVISFDNPLYKSRVSILKGHKQILYLYGYTKEMSYGLSYPDASRSPNFETVVKVAADLAIAYFEIDLYINGEHPHPMRIGAMIQNEMPRTSSQKQTDLRTDLSSGYESYNSNTSSTETLLSGKQPTLNDVPKAAHPPLNGDFESQEEYMVLPTRFSSQIGQDKQSSVEQKQATQKNLQPSTRSPILHNQVSMILTKCGICKKNDANMRCNVCSQPRCERCDELWHKHPQRQGHQRLRMVPEISEAPRQLEATRDVHQISNGVRKGKTIENPALGGLSKQTRGKPPSPEVSREITLLETDSVTWHELNHPESDLHTFHHLDSELPIAGDAVGVICGFCGNNQGKKVCKSCEETYCLDCDQKRHNNERRKGHVRYNVDEPSKPGTKSSNPETLKQNPGRFSLPEDVANETERESKEPDLIGDTFYSIPDDTSHNTSESDLDVRAPPHDTYRIPEENLQTLGGKPSILTDESPYMIVDFVSPIGGRKVSPQDGGVVGTSEEMALQTEKDKITAEDIAVLETLMSVRSLKEQETDPIRRRKLLEEEEELNQRHEDLVKKLSIFESQASGPKLSAPEKFSAGAVGPAGEGIAIPQDKASPRLKPTRTTTPSGSPSAIGNLVVETKKPLGKETRDAHQGDPDIGWTCQHCTFMNSNMESNICEVCNKTSFQKAKVQPAVRGKQTIQEQSSTESEIIKKQPQTKAERRKKNAEYYQQLEEEMLAEKQLAKEEYSRSQATPTVYEPKKVMEKSKPLSDTDLLEIAQQIPRGKLMKLGFELGFSHPEISRLQAGDQLGISGGGAFEMLKMWTGDVRGSEQRPKLKQILTIAGLGGLNVLLEENRFITDTPTVSSFPESVSDKELLQLSQRIPVSMVHHLGCNLGLSYSKIQSSLRMNRGDSGDAVLHMLQQWKTKTGPSTQRRELNRILESSDLGGLALKEGLSKQHDTRPVSQPVKIMPDSSTQRSRIPQPTSEPVSDQELLQITRDIPEEMIKEFGLKLGLNFPKVNYHLHMEWMDSRDAVFGMLHEWRMKTATYVQRRELNSILEYFNLRGLALKPGVSNPKVQSDQPRGITDMELYELADSLNAGNITELGLYLGFGTTAISRYQHEASLESPRDGTRRMLTDWKSHTPEMDQRDFLSNVLEQIGCKHLGEKIRNYSGFTRHHDMYGESLQQQLSHATSFGDLSYVKVEEKMRYEEMRTASLKVVAQLREAESQGIPPKRLKSAQYLMESHGDDKTDRLDWIAENWLDVVNELALQATQELRENLEVDVDTRIMELVQVSEETAEICLEDCSGNVQEAIKECTQRIQEKILEIQEIGCYSVEDIVAILKQEDVDGDAERALEALQTKAMSEYADRVWKVMDVDDNQYFQEAIKEDNRSIRMLMVEYNMRSWGRAQTAAKLILKNEFLVEDVMVAAEECGDLKRSEIFLKQECSVCFTTFPRNKLMSLINCQCMMCRECVIEHFEIIARDKSIMKGKCPSCDEPNLDDIAVAADYFAFLDILLREMLSDEVYELFQRKLRDWNLMQDQNFCWCAHCNSGFINGAPDRRKMRCPECNKLTCFLCKKQWMDQHEGISCEEFQEWKEKNDPDLQAQGLAAHLNENGIECPRCKMRYELAKGGCMHFKCPQCTFEFCCGCNEPMKKADACTKFASCRNKGLHAHHPRDCLFYLRDEPISFLQKLLEDANVDYNKDPPENADENEEGVCGVREQKDGPNGLEDDRCGRTVNPKNAGLCRIHYIEYLVGLINGKNIDPAKSFSIAKLEIILKRDEIPVPDRMQGEADLDYRRRLLAELQAKIPLKKSGRQRVR